jgi:hypothetical protein
VSARPPHRCPGRTASSATRIFHLPRSWRTPPTGAPTPEKQQRALAGALSEVGWVQQVIVNQQTGHLIDGHLRVELARAANEPVPVVYSAS